MLLSIRLPEPTFTFACRRSLNENDSWVALRTGPVPFGTDGAAPARRVVRDEDVCGVSNNHTEDFDFGDTTGFPTLSLPPDGAAIAEPPVGITSTDAANSAEAMTTAALR
ncbi:hypothetical protein MRQ36_01315 [Micromonospora sp. R77]|uniref:hypothetical protein n=1 Tax=Micromonospora sp. R77 TaxID=2925836 RepID=UPI001F624A3A|nr:hypothetical protein [Micromonospora sp. R77]MCI4061284.1 hypothetical protein [Micromonospora sp. R77]